MYDKPQRTALPIRREKKRKKADCHMCKNFNKKTISV